MAKVLGFWVHSRATFFVHNASTLLSRGNHTIESLIVIESHLENVLLKKMADTF